MIVFFVLIFGLCIGSFLNVCICRIPRQKSVVSPPSLCPKCRKSIKWFDNIPLISYVLLKGRCRFCKEKISAQYFIVELEQGIEGLIHVSELSEGENLEKKYKIDMNINAKIVKIDLQGRKIGLSTKESDSEQEKEKTKTEDKN